jgi:hypothetical protein
MKAGSTRCGESGYTLLLALSIAAMMIISASVAVSSLILQSRRQQEQLLIWRGEQYARAIGLFYRKTGHYPHNLEELSKGVAGVHFLRKEYKDPMNHDDGSWRLIYLGPGGQLIGSLRWHSLAEYQAAQMGLKLPGTAATTATEESGSAKPTSAQPGTQETGAGQPKEKPLPTRIINEGDMVGGNLIGVASKVDAKSVKVFMGREKYREWEFLWNPLQGAKGVVTPGSTTPTGEKGAPGAPKPPAPQPPQPSTPQP